MIEKLNMDTKNTSQNQDHPNKTHTQPTTGVSCLGETLSSIHILAMKFLSFADALFVIVMTPSRN